MSLLVISPDFASHYNPLAVVAAAASDAGRRVVVATGPNLRRRVKADGFEWRMLPLGASANTGIAVCDPSLAKFIAATADGPIATMRRQALDREQDLLWEPERVAVDVARLCDDLQPEQVIVDQVSFASTLAMYATGRSFATLVPGHPSQLPVGSERYGVPEIWPLQIRPDPQQLAELRSLVDRVTAVFTDRWNSALAAVAPGSRSRRRRVSGARRPGALQQHRRVAGAVSDRSAAARSPLRRPARPQRAAPDGVASLGGSGRRSTPGVRGTRHVPVVSQRRPGSDHRIASASRGSRAAVATGATPVDRLGPIPDDWVVAPELPQVAMLQSADLVVHHGGNNSVQEALAAGVRQIVLPFSTDQFSNAADLERIGAACVLSPNEATAADLALAIDVGLTSPRRRASDPVAIDCLVDAVFG